MGKIFWDHLDINGVTLYIKVHLENRRNVRSSMGKEYVILRIPRNLSKKVIDTHIDRCKEWVRKILSEKPDIIRKYQTRDYRQQPYLSILNNKFIVRIEKEDRENGKATIKEGVIRVIVPEIMDSFSENKMIRTLISRSLANAFKKTINEKVMEYNKQFFKKEINKVSLKYNVSNWGSCSSKSNINLSTRLLLTPEWVIDYVVVHELSHLVEMNHSQKFWDVLAGAYPEYEKAEKWLKKNNNSCYF